jgi:hypothetical protein
MSTDSAQEGVITGSIGSPSTAVGWQRPRLSVVASSVVRTMSSTTYTLDPSGFAARSRVLTVEDVRALQELLLLVDRELPDDQRIDLIRALEELKCGAEATQAALTADFDESMRSRTAEAGVPPERQGRGIAAQVAFARRESLHRGERHRQLAMASREMPHTREAWREGRVTEWTVTQRLKQTACLSREDRMAVDVEVAGDPDALEAMSTRQAAAAASAAAYRADPMSFVERRRKAEADRHTTLRPAPDVMTWFTALLTVKQGVAVHAALSQEADRRRAAGDERSRGQIMADTLVDRVLAPLGARTSDGSSSGLPLMVNLVVRDTVLLGDDDGPGWVEGFGEVPGDLLREWIAASLESGLDVWLKRLYEKPETGELIAMDSRARRFDGGLAAFLRLRDRGCRETWCAAQVRHLDHAVDVAMGGATDTSNGQGVCEGHNYAKQAHGWSSRPRPGPRHTIETTLPTGHTYVTTAPRLGPEPTRSPRENLVAHLYWAA